MRDWNWGQMIVQALLTGAVFAGLRELFRWIDRRRKK